MLSPGDAVGRWVVERSLGEGGMAVVYLVRHDLLGTRAALKVLTFNHSVVRQRFVEEGRAQAALKHPNIVSVLDVLTVAESPALLLEYVEGPSLADWLDAAPPTLDQAEEVFRGIVHGVAAAHAAGYVHRDLKPANVLLATVDGRIVPKVTDFGLVKVLGLQMSGATATGVAMGTPGYMAPEQIRNAKWVDERADLFSLGSILYELVTGRLAFDGESGHDILTKVATGEYVPPEELTDVPPHLGAAIRGCLQVHLDHRLQSCQDLLDVLDGEALPLAEPPTLSTSFRLPSQPGAVIRPMLASAAIVVLLVLAAVSSLGIFGLARFAGTTADAAPSPVITPILLPIPVDRPAEAALVERNFPTGPPKEAGLLPIERVAPPAPLADDDGPARCKVEPGRPLGWTVATPFLLRKGATWRPITDRKVYADRPRETNGWDTTPSVACVLPHGTRVQVADTPVPIGGSGTWVPIAGAPR
jgi:hypothetical protein